jgi:hypothetical protein
MGNTFEASDRDASRFVGGATLSGPVAERNMPAV